MKFHYLVNIFVALLLALTIETAPSENDGRKEISEKLAKELKTEGLELFNSALTILEEFYDTILNKLSPAAKEIAELNENKNDLKELSNNLESMSSKNLIKSIENVITHKYSKMADYRQHPDIVNNTQKSSIITKALEESGTKLKVAGKKFTSDVCDKWAELYKTIPREELDKFPQYKRINDLMFELKKNPGDGAATFEVIKAIITFFEYNDWRFLLEIGNQMKF